MIGHNSENKRSYKIFIEGELVNLCIPSAEAIELDGWADWFNMTSQLENTIHGVFPNFPETQFKILEEIKNRDKIVLLICEKSLNRAFGVVSLQAINLVSRSAEIAINIGNPELSVMPSLAALEAMALISEHGFSEMGLERIYAGQAYPNLVGWNKLLEVIGFKVEGITRGTFKRGHKVSDTVLVACRLQDYLNIKKIRGSLWGDRKFISKVLRSMPCKSYAEKVDELMNKLADEHFKQVFNP
jgi:RimJ/RimL family protein N-acetyltransferase